MERINLQLTDEAFDKAVHGSGCCDDGKLNVAVKDNVCIGGNPGVCIHFRAGIPYGMEPADIIEPYERMPKGGRWFNVQTTTTVKLFLMAAVAMCGKYPDIAKEMGIHVVGPKPATPRSSEN